jgi:hypothetical protein
MSANRSSSSWVIVADCGDGGSTELLIEDGQMYGGPRGSLSINDVFRN